MNERERILAQVAESKLSIDEAMALLSALDQEESEKAAAHPAAAPSMGVRDRSPKTPVGKPRFLRVIIKLKEAEKPESVDVNLCLPLAMARALGSSLTKVIPHAAQEKAREHGFDFSQFDLNEALEGLDDTVGSQIVDVQLDSGDGDVVLVRIFAE